MNHPNNVIIRPASTIMILHEDNNKEVQVLLLKRNPALKFAAGFWVFPGGAIELKEIQEANSILDAARIAAARETEEETGKIIDPSTLHHYVHWTTPKGGQRRFATWFFYGWASNLKVQVDNSEIVDYKWLPVSKALDMIKGANTPILPPTYVSIYRISQCNSKAEIDSVLQSGTPIVMPRTKFKDKTFYSFYKGDVAYVNKDENLEGAKHRIVGDMNAGEYRFEYHGCDHIMPVTGHII